MPQSTYEFLLKHSQQQQQQKKMIEMKWKKQSKENVPTKFIISLSYSYLATA